MYVLPMSRFILVDYGDVADQFTMQQLDAFLDQIDKKLAGNTIFAILTGAKRDEMPLIISRCTRSRLLTAVYSTKEGYFQLARRPAGRTLSKDEFRDRLSNGGTMVDNDPNYAAGKLTHTYSDLQQEEPTDLTKRIIKFESGTQETPQLLERLVEAVVQNASQQKPYTPSSAAKTVIPEKIEINDVTNDFLF